MSELWGWKSWDGTIKIGEPGDYAADSLAGCAGTIAFFVLMAAIMVAVWLAWQILCIIVNLLRFTAVGLVAWWQWNLGNPRIRLPISAIVLGVVVLTGWGLGLPHLVQDSLRPITAATAPVVAAQPSRPTTAPLPTAAPTTAPTPVRRPLTSPYWVKNHKIAGMWSASGDPGDDGKPSVRFGTTSNQFCVFQVVLPQERGRLYVRNPFTKNYFWIDADAVGPINDLPERHSGPKPSNQNCGAMLYADS